MVKCIVCLLIATFLFASINAQTKYPETKKTQQTDKYHDTAIADPYRWLENDTSAETKEWVTRQNKVTFTYLDAIPFRQELRKRIAAYYNYPRYSTPFRKSEYYYFFKNDGLQNHAVLYRQLGLDGAPDTVINPNNLSDDGSTRLVDFVPSRDGRYAAWGISVSGSDWQTFFVRDLQTMQDLADTVRWIKASDIAWHNNGFYYSRYPEPPSGKELSSVNEYHQVWYHTVGTSQKDDKLIYKDTLNPLRFHFAYTSEDERFLFLSISDRGKGLLGNALFYADVQDSAKGFKPIIPEVGNFLYGVVDHVDGKFLIQTNENAANSKLILFDPAKPAGRNRRTIIPEKPDPLKNVNLAGGQLFAQYLKDVASQVMVYTPEGKFVRQIELPGFGNTDGFKGLHDDTLVFYSYNSLNYPTYIYKYEIKSGISTVYRKPEIQFNPEDYVIQQKFFTVKDKTKVPMFIVHKKGVVMNGLNPALMYGYGGFNVSLSPTFNPSLIPWLEQGGIFALVNLRGGGEYGEQWHKAGMLEKKQRVFDDFIAAAEYLVKRKYTSSSMLAIRGGSNGGLLVGAVVNQRPDLFKVAIAEVGVMDMLRFHKFTIGWNWIAEYGSSDKEEDFKYLIRYSPLHNIKAGIEYPAVMITTADHDDRVVPAHSFKYAATMQEKHKGDNPILLRVDTKAGHGLSSIRKNIELAGDIYSFIMFNIEYKWKNTEKIDDK